MMDTTLFSASFFLTCGRLCCVYAENLCGKTTEGEMTSGDNECGAATGGLSVLVLDPGPKRLGYLYARADAAAKRVAVTEWGVVDLCIKRRDDVYAAVVTFLHERICERLGAPAPVRRTDSPSRAQAPGLSDWPSSLPVSGSRG